MTLHTLYKQNKELYNNLSLSEYKQVLENYYKHTMQNTRSQKLYEGVQTTYGEIELSGIDKLMEHLSKYRIKYNNFIDIGCGKGRGVLYMSGFDNIKKSIGIEIVTERVNHARDVMNKMNNKYGKFLKSVVIIEADFTKYNIKKLINDDDRIFIWISNLCFSETVNANILSKIHEIFGNRFVICCSRELPHNNRLRKIFVEPIKMTWDSNSNVHAYVPVR